jgi:hypothetical protein
MARSKRKKVLKRHRAELKTKKRKVTAKAAPAAPVEQKPAEPVEQ